MASKSKRGRNDISGLRWFFGEVFGLARQFGYHAIWAIVACWLIFEAAHTFQAFAGRTSVADLAFRIAAQIKATVALSLALSGVTTIGWANEYRRHRKTRKRLTERITELELRLDGGRESSLLTREGTTREGDQ